MSPTHVAHEGGPEAATLHLGQKGEHAKDDAVVVDAEVADVVSLRNFDR